MSPSPPLVLSPALPSELLTYLLDHHLHPTTLIICSSRSEFLHRFSSETSGPSTATQQPTLSSQVVENSHGVPPSAQNVLALPISHVAVARHIRTIYIPTVTHLRAYLTVFSPRESRLPAPPPTFNVPGKQPPHLIIYGLLDLHRDTSEWSTQGIGDTLAVLVETVHRLQWQLAVIEPREIGGDGGLRHHLAEKLPILNSNVKAGFDSEEGAWSGRSIEVGRVLSRWFQFRRGSWHGGEESHKSVQDPEAHVDAKPEVEITAQDTC